MFAVAYGRSARLGLLGDDGLASPFGVLRGFFRMSSVLYFLVGVVAVILICNILPLVGVLFGYCFISCCVEGSFVVSMISLKSHLREGLNMLALSIFGVRLASVERGVCFCLSRLRWRFSIG